MKRSTRTLLVVLALVGAVFAAFGPAASNDFVSYDDELYITNRNVERGLTWRGFVWSLTTNRADNWHPVTWWSHMLDVQLFGLDPGAHHLMGVGYHAATAVLLLLALSALTGSFWRSAAVAFFFALHPLRVESVAWASERKDLLSGLFWMATLASYASYVRRPGGGRYLLVAVTLALGLLSKPTGVTLPFVLLLLDFWPLRRDASAVRRIVEKVPLLLLVVGSSVATAIVQGRETMSSFTAISLPERAANAVLSYVAYLRDAFWPVELACFYPHRALVAPESFNVTGAAVLGGVALLLGITLLVWLGRRSRPYALVGWFWYLGTLVPMIGLVQVGLQSRADRYTYIPLIGITLVLVWEVGRWLQARPRLSKPVAVGTAAVLLVLGMLTRRQVAVWRDTETLFLHAAAVTEGNFVAHISLGNVYTERGELERATHHVEEALAIASDRPQVHSNLGGLYLRQGDTERAVHHFRTALRLRPGQFTGQFNLALALKELGQLEEAVAELRSLQRRNPNQLSLRLELGWLYLTLGRLQEAEDQLTGALGRHGKDARLHGLLGRVLLARGREREALTHLEQGLEQEPLPIDTAERLAWLLATSSDETVRDADRAVDLAERAMRLSKRRWDCLRTLAAATAETGDLPEAVRLMERALDKAPEDERAELRGQLEELREGRPLRSGA